MAVCILLVASSHLLEAKSKGDLYILGSSGCGIVYKSKGKEGKKGETIIMNSCHGGSDDDHHDSYPHFMPYPYYGRKRRSIQQKPSK